MNTLGARLSGRGYTLIEVISVLVLLGIAGAVIVNRFQLEDANLSSESERLRSHIHFVQMMAISNEGYQWGIEFNEKNYRIDKRNGGVDLSNTVNLPGETDGTHRFPESVRISSGLGTVQFDKWGSPGSSSYTVTLNGSVSIRITAVSGWIE